MRQCCGRRSMRVRANAIQLAQRRQQLALQLRVDLLHRVAFIFHLLHTMRCCLVLLLEQCAQVSDERSLFVCIACVHGGGEGVVMMVIM